MLLNGCVVARCDCSREFSIVAYKNPVGSTVEPFDPKSDQHRNSGVNRFAVNPG